MRFKILALLSLVASALVFSGCAHDEGQSQMGPKETNFFGIYTKEKACYLPTGPNTFAVNTDELHERRNFSGDRTTYLWGLFTVEDY